MDFVKNEMGKKWVTTDTTDEANRGEWREKYLLCWSYLKWDKGKTMIRPNVCHKFLT